MKLKCIDAWQKIYLNNQKLDEIFINNYQVLELDSLNRLEFLVEFGEFVNETKCFKFWSVKKPNQQAILEEYADCITMLLTLCSGLKIENPFLDLSINQSSEDLLTQINQIYIEGTKLLNDISKNLVISLLSNLLSLSFNFNFTEEEILDALKTKQAKIDDRLANPLY